MPRRTNEGIRARVLIIAVWFGRFPDWMPLWLESCGQNSKFHFLVVTDASRAGYNIPVNVSIVNRSMEQVAESFRQFNGAPVSLTSVYKTCDFKPLYSCLTSLVPGVWDYWAHCDLDMLFGDLSRYITDDLLESHDRIFGLGHFSIYANNSLANRFYRRPHPQLNFREILGDPKHRGFDEHQGVNKIWKLHGGRFYENESLVADIDPHILKVTLNPAGRLRNYRWQVLGYRAGRVFRIAATPTKIVRHEFMYVHFQKRKMSVPTSSRAEGQGVWLRPDGFQLMAHDARLTRRDIHRLSIAKTSLSEMNHRVRRVIRSHRRW